MVLQTLLWPDEIRAAEFPALEEDVKIRPQELAMAASLIDSMATDYDPEQYEDDYQIQLQQLIEAKATGGTAFPEAAEDEGDEDDEVADLLAALRASVKSRESAKPAAAAEKKPARKRAAS